MAAKIDHSLERLVFFSDAVFAIAITLLVIEIQPPRLDRAASDAAHWAALAQLIPNFVGYFMSFAIIGVFWMGHHRAFGLTAHYSQRIVGWNLALLSVIAFMPFVTAYFSANIRGRVPVVIYVATMFVAALLNLVVNWAATSPPMVREDADLESIRYVRRRSLSLLLGSAGAIGVSIVHPEYGQLSLISIAFWRRLLARVGPLRKPDAPAAG